MGIVRTTDLLPEDHQLRLYAMDGVKGDKIEVQSDVDIPTETKPQICVFVKGKVMFRRLTGTVVKLGYRLHQAGDVGTDSQPIPVMPAGKFEYEVLSDTAKWYCIKNVDNTSMEAKTLRVYEGKDYTVPVGKILFVARGEFTIDGKGLSCPQVIHINTKPVQLIAKTNVFGLEIVAK